jgi:hypothetical protein
MEKISTKKELSLGLVSATVVNVTPKLAEELLAKNARNRNIRASRVAEYAREMQAGNWLINGETIVVSESGNLLNGQHRLKAVIKADVAVPMLLATGVAESAFPTLDAGLSRKAADTLNLRGVASATRVAAMARLVLNYVNDSKINDRRSPREIDEVVRDHPEIIDYTNAYRRLIALGRTGAAACVMIADRFSGKSPLVTEFAEGVMSGADLAEGDVRLAYRNRMIGLNRSGAGFQITNITSWHYTQVAIDHWVSGRPRTQLRLGAGESVSFSEIKCAERGVVASKW